MLIFDGHNDTLLSLWDHGRGHGRTFFARSEHGEVDLPRAREGGLRGGFFAVFVPGSEAEAMDFDAPRRPDTPPQPSLARARALEATLAMLGIALGLEAAEAPGLSVVRTVHDLDGGWPGEDVGPLLAVLHLEGAEALDPSLADLPALHALGVRSIGLVWSRPNAFGHGVPFAFPASPDTGPGLTGAGRSLVRACERLGMVVDLAHLNERGFWDVAELSPRPLVVSHTGAHALTASARNLTDAQLDAVGASGGIVGITFHTEDLTGAKIAARADVVRHVAYVAERIGVEHVALGSDFDGARMPADLPDATALPALVDDLRALGFDEDALAAVAHGNWLRVLREALVPRS